MQIHIVKNGSIKLVVTADSEIDKMLLDELFKQPVDVQVIDKMQIVDRQLTNNYVITAKSNQPIEG